MAYCTRDDMVSRFSEQEIMQLTDNKNLGLIDELVLSQAISDASAEIDGYLSAYSLPLEGVPAVLVRSCCDVARYYLYDDGMIDRVEKRYDAVIKYLSQIAKGNISLGLSAAGASVDVDDLAEMQSDASVFSRSSNGFI